MTSLADAPSSAALPPASASLPASASPDAVDGGSVDGLGEDERDDESMSEDAASSDSDYVPGVSSACKGKKRRRRLKRGSDGRRADKRAAVADPDFERAGEEEGEDRGGDAAEDPRAPRASLRAKKQEAVKQWVDDGSAAAYQLRLAEHRRRVDEDERLDRESFYRKPASVSRASSRVIGSAAVAATAAATAADVEGEDDDDGDFHNDIEVEDDDGADVLESETETETETEAQLRSYGPGDVLETDSGLLVPKYVYAQLFPHQRECLEWLHQLHERNTGGILGDEMGLGKTVQVVAFLGAMHHARRLRSVLLLCPASVLLQWVRELHKWYPPLRVVLLHASGSGVAQAGRTYRQLVDEVVASARGGEDGECGDGGGVVVTTYEHVRQYQELFMDVEWDYVVLDEGHRIRNPDAEITLVCKQLQTVHRLILTGTPIQNRLRELWSLFDFVYPGKLGTLPTFDDEFVLPIRAGGYANASKIQVLMAYKCALALKDLIHPFLLRRTKKEVQSVTRMPDKMEQILFCGLTERQRRVYQRFLASPEVAKVLRREIRPFRAISVLRHICNHPDLLQTMGEEDKRAVSSSLASFEPAEDEDADEDADGRGRAYGDPAHSGKMLVLLKVLAMWKAQGHRVLLFTQTRKMLDILESLMARLHYAHCRLDGTTSVRARQALLDAFNAEGSELFVFLLTTRAGGIGVNLTGADRVLIFDPDWNPSTDLQARERSWRLGQRKQVTIYRLLTTGTIEEKIYHRQIFKQYLTAKVLHDAKRKRCFNKHTLRDLFVLGDADKQDAVETSDLFVAGAVERPGGSGSGMTAPAVELEDGEEKDEDNDDDDDDGDGRGDGEKQSRAEQTDAAATKGDNDAILRQLFDGEGLRGVFDHDAVEADGVQNQEADLVDMEASKVAASALGALRASCRLVREQRASAFTPTWTGRRGAAGDPSRRRATAPKPAGGRFGGRVAHGRPAAVASSATSSAAPSAAAAAPPASRRRATSHRLLPAPAATPVRPSARSSRELLTAIRMRRDGVESSAGGGSRAAAPLSGPPARGYMSVAELARQLHAFLTPSRADPRRRDGVTTEQVLEAFGGVVAPRDKLVFRKLLRDMAECRGRKWRLRADYRHE